MRTRLCPFARCGSQFSRFVPPLVLSLAVLLTTGCGSSGTKTTFSGNTTVVILASSMASYQPASVSRGAEELDPHKPIGKDGDRVLRSCER